MKSLEENVKTDLNLSNSATKADLKNLTGVDTMDFAQKNDQVNYIATQEFNKLTSKTFAARLAQANVTSKKGIANFRKKTFWWWTKKLNKEVTSNKTKHVLIENEFEKIQKIDSSLFIGQSVFGNDGPKYFLKFQSINKTATNFFGLPKTITESESKRLSDENTKPPFSSNYSLSPKLVWMNSSRIRIEFKGSSLKQGKITFNQNNVVNLFIVYELDNGHET